MNKKFGIISGLCLIIVLGIMYGTNIGIPGIKQYYSGFKLIDMQFSYSYQTVLDTFNNIGSNGILHYTYYLIVDGFFIITLLLFQILLSHNLLIRNVKMRNIVISFAVLRAVFDVIEDTMLMLLLKKIAPLNKDIITVCSTITSCKFVMLYLWVILLCLFWLYLKKHKQS